MPPFSKDQEQAVDMIKQWFHSGGEEFRLGGLAGTGKTTIISQLPELLGLRYGSGVVFLAPTGKAASVLARKLPSQYAATTVHRFMYQPRDAHCGKCDGPEHCHGQQSRACGKVDEDDPAECKLSFKYNPPEPPPELVIVDEASMVGLSMYGHLKDLNTQVLFVGDHGQLAPIDGGVTVMKDLNVTLERIHRQASGSAILQVAMMARNGVPIKPGNYGDGVKCLLGSKLAAEGFDADASTMVICYTNEMRKRLNRMIRTGLGFTFGQPQIGDRVVCLKNNYSEGVANGQLGTVMACRPVGKFYRLAVRMDDSDVEYSGMCLIDQFHELAPARFIRGVDMWTYGYCLTAHKAQGSEASDVIVVQEENMRYMSKAERRRWMYTAITRAKQRLTIYTPVWSS